MTSESKDVKDIDLKHERFGRADVIFPNNKEKYHGYISQTDTNKFQCRVKLKDNAAFSFIQKSYNEALLQLQEECAIRDIPIQNLILSKTGEEKKMRHYMILG